MNQNTWMSIADAILYVLAFALFWWLLSLPSRLSRPRRRLGDQLFRTQFEDQSQDE